MSISFKRPRAGALGAAALASLARSLDGRLWLAALVWLRCARAEPIDESAPPRAKIVDVDGRGELVEATLPGYRAFAARLAAAGARGQGCGDLADAECLAAALISNLHDGAAAPPVAEGDGLVEPWFDVRLESCRRGEAAPRVAACELDGASTHIFEHMPHAAQTLYQCWSFFRFWNLGECAVLLEGGLWLSPWAAWLVAQMGCWVWTRLADEPWCSLVGWPAQPPRTNVSRGDAFAWFANDGDARALGARLPPAPSGSARPRAVGAVQRASTRRVVGADLEALGDVAVLERMPFAAQASFFASHEVIVAAHGAALTWAAYVQRCTAVVVLYPPDYYPLFYFERLVEDAGGVALPWWRGAYVGDDPARLRASQHAAIARSQNASATYADQIGNRAKDIHIEPHEIALLLDTAARRRARCLAGEDVARMAPPRPPWRDRTGRRQGAEYFDSGDFAFSSERG